MNCSSSISKLFDGENLYLSNPNHLHAELSVYEDGDERSDKKRIFKLSFDDKAFLSNNSNHRKIFEAIIFYGIGINNQDKKFDKDVGRWVLSSSRCFSVGMNVTLLDKSGLLPVVVREMLKSQRFNDDDIIIKKNGKLTFPVLEDII